MDETVCPLCSAPLELREVAPCADCGHRPEEIRHFQQHLHTYDEVRLFGQFTLVLCDFCQADFGSYYPEYFGLPSGTDLDALVAMETLNEVKDAEIQKDGYCPQCQHRLVFLEFLNQARKMNQVG